MRAYLQPDDFSSRGLILSWSIFLYFLTKILPAIPPLINPSAKVVTLIKPQFEVGREEVGRGGIVRDEAAQKRVVDEIVACAQTLRLKSAGVIDSPIMGADGNREFLACFELVTSSSK
ncbi:MAG: hypothetical protein IPG76_24740 [Acidobacteria bacterium]|nr:hypothetical protein [Acidobacteriota bacterium]